MVRTGFSPQTLAVFGGLLEGGHAWHHGYDLAKRTGLKSGTLYPILVRLADRGLVEARWEDEQPSGRPRRHLYRLTASGTTAAHEALKAPAAAPKRAAEGARAAAPKRVRRPAVST
jgi:DNA-binding PadR family transcriptional regulator